MKQKKKKGGKKPQMGKQWLLQCLFTLGWRWARGFQSHWQRGAANLGDRSCTVLSVLNKFQEHACYSFIINAQSSASSCILTTSPVYISYTGPGRGNISGHTPLWMVTSSAPFPHVSVYRFNIVYTNSVWAVGRFLMGLPPPGLHIHIAVDKLGDGVVQVSICKKIKEHLNPLTHWRKLAYTNVILPTALQTESFWHYQMSQQTYFNEGNWFAYHFIVVCVWVLCCAYWLDARRTETKPQHKAQRASMITDQTLS